MYSCCSRNRRIIQPDSEESASSGQVNARLAEFLRSKESGVRFGVRCGPQAPVALAAQAVRIGGEGRNRSPQASFMVQKCLVLPVSQALHRHHLTQHFLNTFADVFADSEKGPCNSNLMREPPFNINAPSPESRQFFSECDRLSLSLESVHSILKQCVGDAPSYQALRVWKRGGYASPLTPFSDWLAILQLAVGESLTAPESTD